LDVYVTKRQIPLTAHCENGWVTYAGGVAITVTRDHNEERLSVPWNLTEWVEAETIRAWVAEEIDSFDWFNPELVKFLRENPNSRPRALLTLLAYSYCTGIYESEEISRLCDVDPALRAICGQPLPSTRALERFRRENRGLLKWLLVQILKRALRAKYGLNTAMLPAGFRQHLVELATERLDVARHMDRAGQGA
jgi:hypothetical protein